MYAIRILKKKINSGLNGIQTHYRCDTTAVLYQLIFQANWKLAILQICIMPIEVKRWKMKYFLSGTSIGYRNRLPHV